VKKIINYLLNFRFFVRMFRTYKLLMIAIILLSSCRQGNDNNEGNTDITQPEQQTSPASSPDGPDLFSKYACFTCHSLEGGVMYGPPLNGIFMKEVNVIRQGREITVVADRDYLTKAITDPEYEKVAEFKDKTMPKPVIPEDDVETLIDYLIKTGEKE
jgi:cytochrome c2